MTSEKEQEQEKRFVVTWQSTAKKTVYDANELQALKRTAGDGSGRGYLYFNPNGKNGGTYERPAAIDPLPPDIKKKNSNEQK